MLRFVRNQPSPIPTRTLGKTGVTLPILGLGTAQCVNRLNIRDAVRLYETAFREGITILIRRQVNALLDEAALDESIRLQILKESDLDLAIEELLNPPNNSE
jgi:hypothetical protein